MGIIYSCSKLSSEEVAEIISLQESWIVEKKGKNITPSKLTKTISAFANSNGGELYLGISHEEEKSQYRWDGFISEEDTNPFISIIDDIMPTYNDYSIEKFTCDDYPTIILHITIHKTQTIIYASDTIPYVRHGVQNLPCKTDEKILRLKMDKGAASYEDEFTQTVFDDIKMSKVLESFMIQVVPRSSTYDWLRRQRVMNDSAKITVAGVLLYDECPQSILPKQSAVRVLRYHTDEKEGTRETLEPGFPISIEGDIYSLIIDTVRIISKIVESTDVVGKTGNSSKKYPEITLHEIITNAILHRDYSIHKDIQVRIFSNRIEIESPGTLPGHVTLENILREQFARNPKIVRLISKFPSPPNKDVGEGLNTAFDAMMKMQLQKPQILETDHSVIVIIKHERLADAETLVLDYMSTHDTISNAQARQLTGITDANKMKRVFNRLKSQNYLEIVPGTRSSATLWQKSGEILGADTEENGKQMTLF
jgi:ATP-dependent DNA helicase RecG